MIDRKKFYVNGKWIEPSTKNNIAVIDPSTSEPFAVISLGDKNDVDIAVIAANEAFENWSKTEKSYRISLLEKIINRGGLKLFILTRLSPVFPFSILNYFYGINKISYKNFSISLIFILPGTYLYCSFGNLASKFNELNNLDVSNNLLNWVSIIATFLVVFFVAKYSNDFINETEKK